MNAGPIAVIHNIAETDGEKCLKDLDTVQELLEKEGFFAQKIYVDYDIARVLDEIKRLSPLCIFNLCEGVGTNSSGEIYIAGLIELLGIPYTGSGPMALSLSLDKAKSKDVLKSRGIKVPWYTLFRHGVCEAGGDMEYPLIVKPACEDGSFGINRDSIVNSKKELLAKVESVYAEFKQPVIVEEYIEGREFNIAIVGNEENIRVLPVSEIDYTDMPPSFPNICTYNAKWAYNTDEYKGTRPVCPAELSDVLMRKVTQTARDVYDIIGCKDYARIDIRLDTNGAPFVIDVNPNPDIAPDAGFARSAYAAGMEYGDLIKEILRICMERNEICSPDNSQAGCR